MTVVGSSVPFGLVVAAREPLAVEDVDLSTSVYDADRQIMLIADEVTSRLVPWCKHSTGKTNTNSNTDGKGGPETDEDYTED
jgi:putative ATP-grasp target RiPP